jgi:hypothetical protein
MKTDIFWVFLLISTMEILAIFVFYWLGCYFNSTVDNNKTRSISIIEVFKGMLERFVLAFGFLAGIEPIIVAFGALKLATRISNQDFFTSESGKGTNLQGSRNNYFLIGNFVSISMSFFYYILINKAMCPLY